MARRLLFVVAELISRRPRHQIFRLQGGEGHVDIELLTLRHQKRFPSEHEIFNKHTPFLFFHLVPLYGRALGLESGGGRYEQVFVFPSMSSNFSRLKTRDTVDNPLSRAQRSDCCCSPWLVHTQSSGSDPLLYAELSEQRGVGIFRGDKNTAGSEKNNGANCWACGFEGFLRSQIRSSRLRRSNIQCKERSHLPAQIFLP
jgi:hypothetical protein